MPVRIDPYQQRVSPSMVGMPRASTPALVDPTGAAIAQLGAQVQKIGADMYDAQRTADLHDRVGKFTAEVSALELEFDRDQDFRTAPDRFKERSEALRDKYLDGVSDQTVAAAFKKQAQTLLLSKSVNVQRDAWKKEADYNVASLDSNIETYATAAANSRNPGEAALVEQQARLAITALQTKGWISAEEAGKRERTFLTKRDSAIVIRDMSIDPVMTATKLSMDAAYAPNLDPVQRERWMDQAFRRAETDERQRNAAAERERKRIGDEKYKEALKLHSEGRLTSVHIEAARPFVEPSEYKSLLDIASGKERRDDPTAYSTLEGLIETNPAEASRMAFIFHSSGLIKSETLSSINGRARTLERQEGPRSEFERSRQFLADTLRPSQFVSDQQGSARYALAVREFDDFANGAKRTDAELREKADEIQRRYTTVDMVKLARETSAGARATPEKQIEALLVEGQRLIDEFAAKKIDEPTFKARMDKLNKARIAAEKAARVNGGK